MWQLESQRAVSEPLYIQHVVYGISKYLQTAII